MWSEGVDWIHVSGQRSLVGFCEQGNEPGDSVNWVGWEVFLRQLSNNATLLLMFTAPLSLHVPPPRAV
jgi:hypothetical protein